MDFLNYESYQEVMGNFIELNQHVRGYQSLMAKGAGCQKSYLSQVLHGHIHLTPDHAAGLCVFWRLSPLETEYFLNLVAQARAGSLHLKKILKDQQLQIRRQGQDLSQRLQNTHTLNENNSALYYSSWHWAAIHLLTSIRRFQNPQAIAERLSLPLVMVTETLAGLERMGLVERQRIGGWRPTETNIHLPIGSVYSFVNHFGWRQRASAQMQISKGFNDLHYTGVHTMSLKDAEKILEVLRQTLSQCRDIIIPSPEEEIYGLMLDFFPI